MIPCICLFEHLSASCFCFIAMFLPSLLFSQYQSIQFSSVFGSFLVWMCSVQMLKCLGSNCVCVCVWLKVQGGLSGQTLTSTNFLPQEKSLAFSFYIKAIVPQWKRLDFHDYWLLIQAGRKEVALISAPSFPDLISTEGLGITFLLQRSPR